MDKVIEVDGISVAVHVDDRDAGEGVFYVDGEPWCVGAPGARFFLSARCLVAERPYVVTVPYDRPEGLADAEAAVAARIRRAVAKRRTDTDEQTPQEPKGTDDGQSPDGQR